MQALVNQGKTKGFNCELRILHYAILLLVVNRCTNTSMLLCSEQSNSYHYMLYIINLILLFLSIFGVCYIHFKYQFPRVEFFVDLFLQTILVGIIAWYSFSSISYRERECIQIIILEKWAIMASLRLVLEVLSIMFFKLFWIQRYTNGPGNLTWSYMFLTIGWNQVPIVKGLFSAIGVAYLIISIVTFILNVASRKADSPTFTKYLQYWWIIAIVTMLVFEGLSIAKLISNDFPETFYYIGAKRMLYIFMIGNLIDVLFWGWGLLTLRVESGDVVREGLAEEQQQIEQDPVPYVPQRHHVQVNELGTVYR